MPKFLLAFLLFSSRTSFSNIRLPAVVTNRMALQRNTILKIWGWADKNERVNVSFLNQQRQAPANKTGKWMLELTPVTEGGPYTMTIKGNNTVTIKDIN